MNGYIVRETVKYAVFMAVMWAIGVAAAIYATNPGTIDGVMWLPR